MLGSFSSPTLVTELSGASVESDPTLTADMLEIFFVSTRTGNFDLWTSTRATVADAWAPPVQVIELESASAEGDPRIARDGLDIWFTSDRSPSAGGLDIWTSSRPARGMAWSAPVPVPELNTAVPDEGPAVERSELMMVLHSTRDGGGDIDLYSTTRPDRAAMWSTPARIAELDTGTDEATGFLADGGLILYFSSTRAGGAGARDLYVAERPAIDQPFGIPAPIVELNTPIADSDPWVSSDQRVIFFARGNGTTGDDIYMATR